MPAESPEALSDAFAAAINARDVPAALDLWMDDAAIVQPDGQLVRGRDAIAGALQALVDNNVTLEILVANVFTAGRTAVAVGALTISGTDGNGGPFRQHSQSIVIYARGADGWRLAITRRGVYPAPWDPPAARLASRAKSPRPACGILAGRCRRRTWSWPVR